MSRIASVFERRAASRSKVLVGYLVAGDPVPAITVPAMHALVAGGVDIIELGMPFSDPEGEGIDIQSGHERALRAGTRLADVFEMVRRFREQDQTTAIVLMGYVNVVERKGVDVFADLAADAGADGALLVNLPPEEAQPLRAAFQRRDLDLILLIAPTTTDARAKQILEATSGFSYYVSLKGTTGSDKLDVEGVRTRLQQLRAMTSLPLAVGFGIRDGASAQSVAGFADAVVVGSAIVRRMASGADDVEALGADLTSFAGELRQAMDSGG